MHIWAIEVWRVSAALQDLAKGLSTRWHAIQDAWKGAQPL